MVMACSKSSGDDDSEGDSISPLPTASLEIKTLDPSVPMKHVGGLHTEEDFARIRAKLAVQAEPWMSGWNKLIANPHAQSTYTANPVATLIRGGSSAEEPLPDNYSRAMNDAAAAYQLALRWRISGDAVYAQAAINVLNAWASTCTRISGNSNIALAAGLYGYQFAIAGEMLRGYQGWNLNDFTAYQKWMKDVFYSLNKSFLEGHFGTCKSHYWANWDLANLNSVLAIGILTDDRAIYNYAITYLQKGDGNGNWYKAINHVFDGENAGLAQIQESGRDQGHTLLCIALMANICQLTWNQGDDFYGLDNNRFLKACEYSAKYNVAFLNVPFVQYTRNYKDAWSVCGGVEVHTDVSSAGRGLNRPMWTAPYFHYTKIKNIPENFIKYTKMGLNSMSTEGGGGDYGTTSGGFDQLGFGTLTYTRD